MLVRGEMFFFSSSCYSYKYFNKITKSNRGKKWREAGECRRRLGNGGDRSSSVPGSFDFLICVYTNSSRRKRGK